MHGSEMAANNTQCRVTAKQPEFSLRNVGVTGSNPVWGAHFCEFLTAL
jgi:hypothetical protein